MARRSLHRDSVFALALLDARSACRRQGDSLAVLLSRLIAAMTDHRLDLLHVATSSETYGVSLVAATMLLDAGLAEHISAWFDRASRDCTRAAAELFPCSLIADGALLIGRGISHAAVHAQRVATIIVAALLVDATAAAG